MSDPIRYLNVDLDLASASDPTALVAALEARGLIALHVTLTDGDLWRASFEKQRSHTEPETTIAGMLAALDSLAEEPRSQ